jgi:hypothetical protein
MRGKLTWLAVMLTTMMLAAAVLPAGAQEAVRTVAAAEPQVKDDLLAGTEKFARGATDVTDVNLDPDMLGIVGGEKSGGLAHKMKFVVVHSYRYPKPGMYKMEDVEPYRQKLRTGNWNCLVHVTESETGKSTDVCKQPWPDNQGSEMVIITAEPTQLTFVHISGIASLADLGKLGVLGTGNKNVPAPPPAAPK